MKIGILREYKSPEDIRVALSPEQCRNLLDTHKDLEIVVEPYVKRCYSDAEYEAKGIQLANDLSDCDVLIGVKEVPKERLIEGKIYFFFSHTIKMQDYNLQLMKQLLVRNISMIDHETLALNGQRIIGFGRWAGIVGAHYALLMMGKKWNHYDIKPANACRDMDEMLAQYKGLSFPKVKIALTGSGRVGKGALEVLESAGIRQVSAESYLTETFDEAVFTVLDTPHLYHNADGSPVVPAEFYENPESAVNGFTAFSKVTDVLIHGIYWDYRATALFSNEEIADDSFKVSVISDITCDVEGSIPITLRQTAIEDPYIGINKKSGAEVSPFGDNTIDVMAVGNLPNELPRNASDDFGSTMMNQVVPELFNFESSELLQSAMICHEGKLMPNFAYLKDWPELF